MKETVTFK